MELEENYDEKPEIINNDLDLFEPFKIKTITKICEHCRTPFQVSLKYARRKIYCSYLCGQRAFLQKHGYQLAKEIRALKMTCSVKGCKEAGSTFINGNSFCQVHYNSLKKQFKSKKTTSIVLVLKTKTI